MTKSKKPEQNGLYYVANDNIAPVIEFSRSNLPTRKYGRIYWAKYFSAPDGLIYDVDTFSKWFDQIVRWVRKHGQKNRQDNYSPYFLPDAWNLYLSAQQVR